MGRHKKVNGVGCLHCAWIDATRKKYPKYRGRTDTKKDMKIADEIVQSAVSIAARAMSSLTEEGKQKFLADLNEEAARISAGRKSIRPLLEAFLSKMTGVEGKIMTLDEVKAMIESLGQQKN